MRGQGRTDYSLEQNSDSYFLV